MHQDKNPTFSSLVSTGQNLGFWHFGHC